ncbi:MAG: MFS transporter [Alphaproteobacteria bacterium]|jgi:MFS family permease|nr:MFS transporter [Alphaproteobacteria bacterium]
MQRLSTPLTLGFAGIAHVFSHMFVLFYATVVLVLEHQWQLPYAELMALSIPGAVMFGAGALPAGWLGDKWSAAGMMAVFFLGTGFGSIWTGLADGPVGVAVGLALLGTFASIYHPVGIPWLLKHAVNRGRALGFNGVLGSFGTALAALVAGGLAELAGWRAAFIVPGVISIIVGLGLILTLRLGWIVERADDAAPQPTSSAGDIKRVFAVLAVTVVVAGLVYQAMSYALPKIFEERLADMVGSSLIGIGGLVSICFLVSGLTQLIGGELADRYSLKLVYAASQGLLAPACIFGFYAFGPVLVGAAILMASFNVIGQPAENALLARHTPPHWRGQVFGVKFVLTLGVSTIGVALIPVIHGMTGNLDGLFVVLGTAALIAFACTLFLPAESRRAVVLASTGDD